MSRRQADEDQLKDDLGNLFRQPAFRRVLNEMIRPCDIIRQSTYGGDAREAAYLEGRRSVVQDQIALLDLFDPYAFATLLKEEIDARADRSHRQD